MPLSCRLSAGQIEALAQKHAVSAEAIETLASAIVVSKGTSAQFNHSELGGMGQWMASGMLMIGDMFNHQLKARVDRLCHDVADELAKAPKAAAATSLLSPLGRMPWWPADLGEPSSMGSQNAMRYAFFPAARRLALQENGALSIYDTGDHRLTGFAQQQSSLGTLAFSSPEGSVPLSKFRRLK